MIILTCIHRRMDALRGCSVAEKLVRHAARQPRLDCVRTRSVSGPKFQRDRKSHTPHVLEKSSSSAYRSWRRVIHLLLSYTVLAAATVAHRQSFSIPSSSSSSASSTSSSPGDSSSQLSIRPCGISPNPRHYSLLPSLRLKHPLIITAMVQLLQLIASSGLPRSAQTISRST